VLVRLARIAAVLPPRGLPTKRLFLRLWQDFHNRKNYLFAGSDCGGERAAAMYSLIGSAKLNGLDPELYLRNVLAQIADYPISRIEELLPWNLDQSLQDQSSQAA
jgi:IS66 C-terminal element